jgi:hypothetical protein
MTDKIINKIKYWEILAYKKIIDKWSLSDILFYVPLGHFISN